MNRTDIYNRQADIAIETAINTMLTLDQGQAGGESARSASTNRKEAMRFLLRRLILKNKNNPHRVIVASSTSGETTS